MRLRLLPAFGITIAGLAVPSESSAQLVYSERITALNVNFLYGGGDGTYPGGDSLSNGSLTSGFVSQLSGQQKHEGFTGDTTWAAGIQYRVDQEVEFS